MAFIDNIKHTWNEGTLLMRFIYINIAVWVVLRLIGIIATLFLVDISWLISLVELPSNLTTLAHRPWTIITYMFAHYDVLHILFNMLWFYWLGRIFLEFFTPKQLGGLYILGGLGGAALYLLAYNLLPYFAGTESMMLGASAAIIAIVIATAVYAPDYKINLLLIGSVSLKWIAIITIFFDFLSIDSLNSGGHISHLGGALVGLLFAMKIKRGHDITSWVNSIVDKCINLFRRRSATGFGRPVENKSYSEPPRQEPAQPTESEIDIILDKIKRNGYAALTDKEKETLFRASRRN